MRTSNLANEALRQAEVGHVWEERVSGAATALTLDPYQTFRVRASAASTVLIDGTLAATMISGEILVFNAGSGQPTTNAISGAEMQAKSVAVTFTGTVFVQVARDNVRKL